MSNVEAQIKPADQVTISPSYRHLWDSMVAAYGPHSLTDTQFFLLPDDEADRALDAVEEVEAYIRNIGDRAELDFDIYSWREEEYEAAASVQAAARAGIRVGFLLAQSLEIAETIK